MGGDAESDQEAAQATPKVVDVPRPCRANPVAKPEMDGARGGWPVIAPSGQVDPYGGVRTTTTSSCG